MPRGETRHLWIGALVLAAMAASPAVRGAVWMNLASLEYHRALMGGESEQAGHLSRARALADRAGAADTSGSRPLVLAAAIDTMLNRPGEAVALLEQAVARDPANDGARFQLAEAYRATGDDEKALLQFRSADAVPMLLQQGADARHAGDVPAAIGFFEQAARVDNTAYQPWIELGNSYWTLRRFEDARQAYTQAIERDPTRARAYEQLAGLLMGPLDTLEEAEAVVADGLLRATEASDDLYYIRSRLAFMRSDYPSAERDARRAISLSPRSGNYLAWLGELYYHQKKYAEALEQYERTVSMAAEPVWLWRGYRRLGQTYAAQLNWSAAVEAYGKALEISIAQDVPPDVRAENRVEFGEALRQNGEADRARAEFTRALAEDPANQRAARFLAAMRRP